MRKLETEVENTGDQLVTMEVIEHTPFTLVKAGDEYFLAMGKYRLTEPMEKEDALDRANIVTWDQIMQVVQIMIEENIKVLTTKNE